MFQPYVKFDWDIDFIGRVQKKLLQLELPTTHLVCVGGWNAPHPDMAFTGKEWFKVGILNSEIVCCIFYYICDTIETSHFCSN